MEHEALIAKGESLGIAKDLIIQLLRQFGPIVLELLIEWLSNMQGQRSTPDCHVACARACCQAGDAILASDHNAAKSALVEALTHCCDCCKE